MVAYATSSLVPNSQGYVYPYTPYANASSSTPKPFNARFAAASWRLRSRSTCSGLRINLDLLQSVGSTTRIIAGQVSTLAPRAGRSLLNLSGGDSLSEPLEPVLYTPRRVMILWLPLLSRFHGLVRIPIAHLRC